MKIDLKEKERLMTKLIRASKDIKTRNSSNPEFVVWRTQSERTLLKIYGLNSIEYESFKKLKFHDPRFAEYLNNGIIENVSQNVVAFNRDFKTAIDLLNQFIEDNQSEEEGKYMEVKTSSIDLPKINWQGTQKQLGELFIELKNKGWIDKIDKELITDYFTNANTISEVLKPAVDKGGEPTYEKIYTKAYKRSFNNIAINNKK